MYKKNLFVIGFFYTQIFENFLANENNDENDESEYVFCVGLVNETDFGLREWQKRED